MTSRSLKPEFMRLNLKRLSSWNSSLSFSYNELYSLNGLLTPLNLL